MLMQIEKIRLAASCHMKQLASSLWISSFDKSDGTTCSKSDERINVDASSENQAC
jgi:hypothetical protein